MPKKYATVNFRLDENVKADMEQACEDMGMSLTTAFTIFAKAVGRERRIPFDVTADPFYSSKNIAYLTAIADRINSGAAELQPHDLIEVDE